MHSKDLAPLLLRVSLAFVFLYFGFSQISSPDSWVGFVPDFMNIPGLTANNLVVLNGILELTLGSFLLIGLYVRFSALILALHLMGITLSIGFSPTGVRDFGLAIATFVIFLNGSDNYSIDSKYSHLFEKKEQKILTQE